MAATVNPQVAAWVWWVLMFAVVMIFNPQSDHVLSVLQLVGWAPVTLAYGVPYWQHVGGEFRRGWRGEPTGSTSDPGEVRRSPA